MRIIIDHDNRVGNDAEFDDMMENVACPHARRVSFRNV